MAYPDLFVDSPKSLLGGGTIGVGEDDVEVVDLVADVFGYVLRSAIRSAGGVPPERVILTHPQAWFEQRKDALRAAWERAAGGESEVYLVSEPVAAASFYAHEGDLPPGCTVGVFDYGGGTCDVAVLRHTGEGPAPFEILGHDGEDNLGGAAIDRLLTEYVRRRLDDLGHGELGAALSERAHLSALRTLRDQVRLTKESLSFHPDSAVNVAVGALAASVLITREEFDEQVSGEVARARRLVERTLAQAGVAGTDLHAMYLTGGSSYVPAIHEALDDLLGGRTATLGDAKLVVALGAHLAPGMNGTRPTTVGASTQGIGQFHRPTIWIDKATVEAAFEVEPNRRKVRLYPRYQLRAAITKTEGDGWAAFAGLNPLEVGERLELDLPGIATNVLAFSDVQLENASAKKPVRILGTDGYLITANAPPHSLVVAGTAFGAAGYRSYTIGVGDHVGSSIDEVVGHLMQTGNGDPLDDLPESWFGLGVNLYGPKCSPYEYLSVEVQNVYEGRAVRLLLEVLRNPALDDVSPQHAAVAQLDGPLQDQRRHETSQAALWPSRVGLDLPLPFGAVHAVSGHIVADSRPVAVVSAATHRYGRHLGILALVPLPPRRFGQAADAWQVCRPFLRAVQVTD